MKKENHRVHRGEKFFQENKMLSVFQKNFLQKIISKVGSFNRTQNSDDIRTISLRNFSVLSVVKFC
ncbi:MAG: hypothetical protein ABH869_01810 [Candidatus Omnitrophota bacterium]